MHQNTINNISLLDSFLQNAKLILELLIIAIACSHSMPLKNTSISVSGIKMTITVLGAQPMSTKMVFIRLGPEIGATVVQNVPLPRILTKV